MLVSPLRAPSIVRASRSTRSKSVRLSVRISAIRSQVPLVACRECNSGRPRNGQQASGTGRTWRVLADLYLTPAREAELIVIFKESTRLDADFWEMGWRAGQRVG
jgi:hypothetical protein